MTLKTARLIRDCLFEASLGALALEAADFLRGFSLAELLKHARIIERANQRRKFRKATNSRTVECLFADRQTAAIFTLLHWADDRNAPIERLARAEFSKNFPGATMSVAIVRDKSRDLYSEAAA